MRQLLIAVVGASVAVFGMAQTAFAAQISTGPGSASYYGGFASINPDPVSAALLSPGTASSGNSSITIAALPSPSLLVSSRGTNAFSDLSYFVQITGPTQYGALPIDVSYVLSAATDLAGFNPSSGVDAYAGINIGNGAVLGGVNNLTNAFLNLVEVTNSGTVSGVLKTSANAGATIVISETANAYNTYGAGQFATASVDPIAFIDPSFASIDPNYLTDFQILLSPGVGNTEPTTDVPEPMTLTLFGAGLAGAAALRRRKRKIA